MNVFEFYVDGDKFYDVRIDEIALINPVSELRENAAGTLKFTIPPKHPKYNSFKPLTSTIEIYRDGEWFWEGRIIDKQSDMYNNVTYEIEGALGYLNDSVQPQAEYHDVTPIGYVERLLNVHNSQVPDNRKIYLGAITVKDPNNSMYRFTNYNVTLKELKEDLIDDISGIIRLRKVDGKLYLDILEDYDRICSQVIRVGQNLIDITPGFDYSDIASVIIPLGATLEDQEDHSEGLENLDKYVEITELNDGKNYLARDDLLETYNQIWQVVHFQDIHTPQNLLRKAQEYLTDGQWGEMVIEAKAFDLNYTSEEFQEFRLGDRVRVKSEFHGIDRYFPLTALTIHYNDIAQNTITLGGKGEPVSISGVTNSVTINTQKLDERVKDPNRLIQQAIYQATQLINQGLNGYVRVNGNEILIMDTDDPATAKHVWRWNMGGLGYSNNGYNGPFETAITMDGTIVGSFIAANSIAAEQIDVNYTSHVERQCNDYTDSKLGDYWTYSQTETYFKTLADQITMGVNTTLSGYVTTEKLSSELSITESNITSKVSDTLSNYSTTSQVQSMIKQSADSITTTLSRYVTDSDFQELEQKITADGIFTTINTGLSGTKNIKTTKFTMDKDGITIQNGGLTIKNNSNIDVLYADSTGNLTMRGDFMHYGTGNYQAIGISGHEVQVYAWNQSGNYLGSLGATKLTNGNTAYIALWSDYGDDLTLGTRSSSGSTTIEPIIRIGSSGGSIGIKYIRGSMTGRIALGSAGINFNNGIYTGYDSNGNFGYTGNFIVGGRTMTFYNGVLSTIV